MAALNVGNNGLPTSSNYDVDVASLVYHAGITGLRGVGWAP